MMVEERTICIAKAADFNSYFQEIGCDRLYARQYGDVFALYDKESGLFYNNKRMYELLCMSNKVEVFMEFIQSYIADFNEQYPFLAFKNTNFIYEERLNREWTIFPNPIMIHDEDTLKCWCSSVDLVYDKSDIDMYKFLDGYIDNERYIALCICGVEHIISGYSLYMISDIDAADDDRFVYSHGYKIHDFVTILCDSIRIGDKSFQVPMVMDNKTWEYIKGLKDGLDSKQSLYVDSAQLKIGELENQLAEANKIIKKRDKQLKELAWYIKDQHNTSKNVNIPENKNPMTPTFDINAFRKGLRITLHKMEPGAFTYIREDNGRKIIVLKDQVNDEHIKRFLMQLAKRDIDVRQNSIIDESGCIAPVIAILFVRFMKNNQYW